MGKFAKEILPINIEDEMKQSYLDYAMSVIVGRALPDVRDGLKPVHRRSLYAMSEMGNVWNKPYKKAARVVGSVLGLYHPHGDSSVYDTIVRMAQSFSLRYQLIDGQGNFGSIDGDAPSAMRYTEVRMSKIAHELLLDIDKETVNFVPNYDGAEQEPTVLPTRIPNLLINGSSGIAVGMATNIPPHNLREVIDACLALIEKPNLPVEALMAYIPGPDFPTAAIISGSNGIVDGYRTGRGRVLMRARTHLEEEKGGREKIVVTELPYQVNKARLIEKIADLVKERKLEGIAELRDESDKDGIRVVVELRRGEVADVILNNLYQHTQLQTAFGINMVALVDGQPRLLNLKEALVFFIQHRQEVVTRRTLFELRKARERLHILEGLAVALSNIDTVIALIKAANNSQEARQQLLTHPLSAGLVMALLQESNAVDNRPEDLAPEYGLTAQGTYQLSETQAQAILDLRLHRLTGLEQEKILEEYRGLLAQIQALLAILGSHERLMQVIREELLAIRKEYGDERRTQILADHKNFNVEDLITEAEVLVTLSRQGYIKAQIIDSYTAQRRGGKGKIATQMKEEDFIDQFFVANTHDTILCFTNWGKVYWLKVYELPQAARIARGKPIVNLLPLEEGERINAVLPVPNFTEDKFVFMATANGTVKKTALVEFSRPRASGIIALALEENDLLIGVDITDGQQDVMLFSKKGKAVRFNESEVRSMGRTARGVRGIKLAPEDKVISLIITYAGGSILTATVNGFGKRTPVEDYTVKGRGTQGVITIKTSERNGEVVGAIQVKDDDDVMLISNRGTLVRTNVKGIAEISRNTQGVNLINLGEGEQLVAIERIEDIEE